MNIVPAVGERALIVGQTGCGKTAFACWLLAYCRDGVIYDTKIEPKFAALPGARVVDSWADVRKVWKKDKDVRFVVFRPPVSDVIDPDKLDHYLLRHYEEMRQTTAYIDEAYQFHNQGRCGPGLQSLLTRGRSRGITTIMSSQRPKWLSLFCLTESQRFYIFRLVDRNDRKRFADIIPGFDADADVPRHYFRYCDFDLPAPVLFSPVPLDKSIAANSTYTDAAPSSALKFI